MHNGKYQCHMAVSCIYTYQKASHNKIREFSGEKVRNEPLAKKQKQKTELKEQQDQAQKGESNDSPEIPDRRRT